MIMLRDTDNSVKRLDRRGVGYASQAGFAAAFRKLTQRRYQRQRLDLSATGSRRQQQNEHDVHRMLVDGVEFDGRLQSRKQSVGPLQVRQPGVRDARGVLRATEQRVENMGGKNTGAYYCQKRYHHFLRTF